MKGVQRSNVWDGPKVFDGYDKVIDRKRGGREEYIQLGFWIKKEYTYVCVCIHTLYFVRGGKVKVDRRVEVVGMWRSLIPSTDASTLVKSVKTLKHISFVFFFYFGNAWNIFWLKWNDVLFHLCRSRVVSCISAPQHLSRSIKVYIFLMIYHLCATGLCSFWV